MDQRKLKIGVGIIAMVVVCSVLIATILGQQPRQNNIAEKVIQDKLNTDSVTDSNVNSTTAQYDDDLTRAKNDVKLKKENLLAHLKNISSTKTIAGLHVFPNRTIINDLEIFKQTTGVLPGILTVCMPAHSDGVVKWLFFVSEVISYWKKGYLMHIVWEFSDNPLTSIHNFTQGQDMHFNDLVTENGTLNQIWKSYLDDMAFYLLQLQDSGVLPIFDIFPYINTDNYLWSGRVGLNGSQKLYKLTHDYLTRHHGLTCLIWMWSMGYYRLVQTQRLFDYWPGNNYADVVGVYMFGNRLSTYGLNRLRQTVGWNTLISMEYIWSVPTIQTLATQPHWSWFTVSDLKLTNAEYNSVIDLNATFQSPSLISHANNEFVSITN